MTNNLNVILTGTPSDSHMWNLIFMELFLRENKCKVHNLGPCVPVEEIYEALEKPFYDLVVISSINGHLFQDAIKIITAFPHHPSAHLPPFVIGGKIGISENSAAFQKKKLIKLGYDDVFIGKDPLGCFKKYLNRLSALKMGRSLKHAV